MANLVTSVLVLLVISSFMFCDTETKFRFLMRKFICESSNKTLRNVSCKYKLFKRDSYLTFRGTMMRKVPNLNLSFVIKRKNSDGYQTILDVKDIEICKLTNNVATSNFSYINKFVDYIKTSFSSTGNWLNFCDFVGEIYFTNGTFSKLSLLEMFPEGDYSVSHIYFDEIDSQAINVSTMFHLTKL